MGLSKAFCDDHPLVIIYLHEVPESEVLLADNVRSIVFIVAIRA